MKNTRACTSHSPQSWTRFKISAMFKLSTSKLSATTAAAASKKGARNRERRCSDSRFCCSSLRLLLLTIDALITDGHDVILSSFDVVDFVSLAPFCSIYNPAPSSLPTLIRPNSVDGQIVIRCHFQRFRSELREYRKEKVPFGSFFFVLLPTCS